MFCYSQQFIWYLGVAYDISSLRAPIWLLKYIFDCCNWNILRWVKHSFVESFSMLSMMQAIKAHEPTYWKFLYPFGSGCIQQLLQNIVYGKFKKLSSIQLGCLVANWLKRWTTDPGEGSQVPAPLSNRDFFTWESTQICPKTWVGVFWRCFHLKFTPHPLEGM